ncbi:MAG: AHH domain-containing protein [Myxococcales bacterium]|nr:AHH domain-containing protein [Myxococcales bacterium]MCB9519644.1 AHH domain-containing protein [Myxococcales bacterium]MCB9530625.1 AHH domain-containing protein [Myxococcales bacterium]
MLDGTTSAAFAPATAPLCSSAAGTCGSQFGNPILWSGAHWRPTFGLYDMRARQYDPRLHTFLSRDPLGYVDSFDEWLYVGGDPFNMWDPFGLDAQNGQGCDAMCRLARNIPTGPRTTRLVNSFGGLGDGMTLGLTGPLRRLAGAGDQVDVGSFDYRSSAIAGAATTVLLSLGATGPQGVPYLARLTAPTGLAASAAPAAAAAAPVAAGAASGGRPSQILGRALQAAGQVRPPGVSAHHIVASSARAAAPARAVLARFGIQINSAVNGVFLPSFRRSPNPLGAAVHSMVHTRAYYQAVNEALRQATTRAEALEVLDALRQALLGGGL